MLTRGSSNGLAAAAADDDDDDAADDNDFFAAFDKNTKVDNASHYPPPGRQQPTPAEVKSLLDLSNPNAWGTPASTAADNTANGGSFVDDDDPFGLNDLKSAGQQPAPASAVLVDDDDFLGDLGKPIEEVRMKQQQQQQRNHLGSEIHAEDTEASSENDGFFTRQQSQKITGQRNAHEELDLAVARLLDYGFSPEDARRGLRESGAGLNVQAAANWLLDDAHRQAKEKAQARGSSARPGRTDRRVDDAAAGSSGRSGEPDLAKSAAAVGNSLFKTANSLWKTGQKKMQQAVADFQQDGGDSSQPKWMREAQQSQTHDAKRAPPEATAEALALESRGRPTHSRPSSRPRADPRLDLQQSRDSSPCATSARSQSRHGAVPRWQQQAALATSDARSRLSKLKDDDADSFSGYVSANRRRVAAAQSPLEATKPQDPEPDLLFNTEAPKPSQPIPQRLAQRQPPSFAKPSQATPPTSRNSTPKPLRQVPTISPAALQASTRHRLEGTAHFKRGDYASAHSSYTQSLSAIPAAHPLLIVLLTNRALTALKTGEPKQAISDADEALKVIGPGNGQGESIAVQAENGKVENRDMKDLFGKALSRKAEALEQMEKWADAGLVWQRCVETGAGGKNAIKGRQRCQSALTPRPKSTPKPAAAAAAAKPRPSPLATTSPAPQKSSEAVTRLRQANEAAAREDDEKFALSEKVDAKVSAWRDGKRDNLRGLIASLDQVLWENSGWKKVGMHELVVASKVKISYMKAIAKTHPDKVSPLTWPFICVGTLEVARAL
ncbi:hypothetical protein UVI_02054520 [Ustilaginoidea virens]|uniref:UBA domain-containing protein n=1 Tax=Ustilaginoidea virens TaxID=1159556 RepID=A0A1B5L4X4_USTVR|nr:hypothetical protein UVI_02054520 [Ustilaginoidea virens]